MIRTVVYLAGALTMAAAAHAQTVPLNTPEPQGVFAEPFSRITGIREMPDGRLLIADRTEQLVAYLDFARGTIERIGREGQGPGEYRTPMALFPLPDGQTLLSDLGNMRMTVIDREGNLGASHPILRQGDGRSFQLILPQGTDREGRIFFSTAGVTRATRGGAQATSPDSATVLRMMPGGETFDTVAMLALPERSGGRGPIRVQGGGTFQIARAMPQPYAPQDDWGVAANGDVVVARAVPYRLDRYTADGRMHRGVEVPYDPVRVTQAVKEAWAEGLSQTTGSFAVAGGGGGSRTIRLEPPDVDEVDFPEFLPPFVQSAVRVAPDAETWIARARAPSSPQEYDVFDTAGRLTRRVRLSGRRALVGIGAEHFYVVATDEDDLQWLERYRR